MLSNFSFQGLALGGLIAGVVAAWSQVRSAFGYLSSFLVIKVDIKGEMLSQSILEHMADSGYRVYQGGVYKLVLRHTSMSQYSQPWVVFRRVDAGLLINPKTLSVVLFDLSDNNELTMYALRGNLNVRLLGLTAGESINETQEKTSRDRYYVTTKTGTANRFPGTGATKTLNADADAPSATSSPVSSLDLPLSATKLQGSAAKVSSAFMFEDSVLDHFKYAEHWYNSSAWYKKRSIPWRLGWLLYGPPGNGKSTTANVVARKLRIPLVRIMLATMSDQDLIEAWTELPRPCVVLFEDIDTVFNKRELLVQHGQLTFECLLNVIGGVEDSEGVFVFVTTNCLDKVDEALGVPVAPGSTMSTRPGRLDTTIYVGNPSDKVRKARIEYVLNDWPHLWPAVVEQTEGLSMAQVQEVCLSQAYQALQSAHKVLDETLEALE